MPESTVINNSPGEDLAELFHRAARLMARVAHRNDHGNHAQERVYAVIRDRGPLPQRELLELFGVRSASLSEVLAKLERAGRITRSRDDNDRRGFVVAATDVAATSETRRPDIHQRLNQTVFACLDEAECGQLAGLLGKLIAVLEKEGPEDGAGHHHHGCGPGRFQRSRPHSGGARQEIDTSHEKK